MMSNSNRDVNHWKGFVLGVAGAAAGLMAMRYYWQGVTAVTGKGPRAEETKDGPHTLDDIWLVGEHYQEGESSTATIPVKFGLTVSDLVETFAPYITMSEGLKLAAQTFGTDVHKLSCCAA